MGRPAPAGGKRELQVLVRLNEQEAADIDARRGAMSRPAFLRWKALGTR